MVVIQRSDLIFEIQGWKPEVIPEMKNWLENNNIEYNVRIEKWGSASFHYHLFVDLETIEDGIAFKLRWM